MVGAGVLDDDLSAGHADGGEQGGRHHPVGDDPVRLSAGSELIDAVDLDVRRPRAADPGPHVA